MNIQLPIVLFSIIIGIIGFLIGALISNLCLKPSIIKNDERLKEHERRLNQFEISIKSVYDKIESDVNGIYKKIDKVIDIITKK